MTATPRGASTGEAGESDAAGGQLIASLYANCDHPCRTKEAKSGCVCAEVSDRIEQLERELAEACRIGLAFIGSMFPDHPVSDYYVAQTEAKLRALASASGTPPTEAEAK